MNEKEENNGKIEDDPPKSQKNSGEIPVENRCERNDGKGWRCKRPKAEGEKMCLCHLSKNKKNLSPEADVGEVQLKENLPTKSEGREMKLDSKDIVYRRTKGQSSNLQKQEEENPKKRSHNVKSQSLSEDGNKRPRKCVKEEEEEDLGNDDVEKQGENGEGKVPRKRMSRKQAVKDAEDDEKDEDFGVVGIEDEEKDDLGNGDVEKRDPRKQKGRKLAVKDAEGADDGEYVGVDGIEDEESDGGEEEGKGLRRQRGRKKHTGQNSLAKNANEGVEDDKKEEDVCTDDEEEDEEEEKKRKRRGRKMKRGRKPIAKVGSESDGNEGENEPGSGKGKRKDQNSLAKNAKGGAEDDKKEEDVCTDGTDDEEEDEEEEKKSKRRGRKMRRRKKAIEKGTPGVGENGAERKKEHDETEKPIRSGRKTGASTEEKKPKLRAPIHDENGIKIDSSMCHQCQRNDKGRVVRCTKCKTKRFCIPCINNWYPQLKEEDIAEACPVCHGNCNCKACLRMEGSIKLNEGFELSEEEKIEHSKNLLRSILPFLKQFNDDQMMEKEMEAKIQGVPVSQIKILKAVVSRNERIYCNNCRTSIVDFHRSCPKCAYDLCLTCCREIRGGQLQGGEEEMIMEYIDRGFEYLHGGGKERNGQSGRSTRRPQAGEEGEVVDSQAHENPYDNQAKEKTEWKVDDNGCIPCPPAEYDDCGGGLLELKSVYPDDWVSKLLREAELIASNWEDESCSEAPIKGCLCFDSTTDVDTESNMRKYASREGSNDHSLYCPDARDLQRGDLKHFQWHWARGEPIIVRHTLETASGLSWEPMVMWRAVR